MCTNARIRDRTRPVRYRYDRDASRSTIVVDVLPATVDDVAVYAGSERIRVRIEDDRRVEKRTFEAPPGTIFTDERKAVYNNGVLEIVLGVGDRSSRNSAVRGAPP